MRASRVILVFAIAAVLLLGLSVGPACAAWGTEPVTVTPTTATIPLVEACADGAHGTFAAWQEERAPGQGVVRVQHLLATGDLDPAWPALGAVACTTSASRTELFALPDRLGGLYLFWKEAAVLYAQRVDATGAVAAGWPTRGRVLGALSSNSPGAGIIEDGANGFYAAWVSGGQVASAIHVGPSNTGAGGWPSAPRTYTQLGHESYWAQVALAPDGGVYLVYATWDGSVPVGSWRLRRLTTAGLAASGWGTSLSFGEFHREYLNSATELSLLGLSADGRGGVFLLIANPIAGDAYYATLETRLYRLQASGATAPDWPAAGRIDPFAWTGMTTSYTDPPPDGSYRVLPDHVDGVLVGTLEEYSHSTAVGFFGCSPSGQWTGQLAASPIVGYEIVPRGDGGFFQADFYPKGPYQPYEPYAFLRVAQSLAPAGWSTFYESHPETVISWYGDIGLASTENGGAVFFWSQVRDRIGLFARKFSSYGEVTGVTPGAPAANALRGLRFVRGDGVRATFSTVGSARLELFDLAGRRVSTLAVDAGDHDLALPGTDAIASGLYFGRLIAGAGRFAGKVLVAR